MLVPGCPPVTVEMGFGAPRSVCFAMGRGVTSPGGGGGGGVGGVGEAGSHAYTEDPGFESSLGFLICRMGKVATIPRGGGEEGQTR